MSNSKNDKTIKVSDRLVNSEESTKTNYFNNSSFEYYFSKHKNKLYFLILACLSIFAIIFFSIEAISNKGFKKNQFDQNIPIQMSGLRLLDYFDNNIHSVDAVNKHGNINGNLLHNSYYDNFRFFVNALSEKSCITQSEVLTRDVSVLNYAHSHNDYWRTLPLYDALLHGINSVEADIWLIKDGKKSENNILAVGHNDLYLKPEQKNLKSLYINPLFDILEQINIAKEEGEKLHGVFFDEPEMPLIIYIDFKNHSPVNLDAYEELLKQLKPLEKYLTTKKDFQKRQFKPLIIELTGDYPILSTYADYIFLDSSLIKVYKREVTLQAPIISESLNNLLRFCNGDATDGTIALKLLSKKALSLSDDEIICISEVINQAHEKNYKVRIWGVPQFPIYNRNHLWKQQLNVLGVDYLNVDDLDAVATF